MKRKIVLLGTDILLALLIISGMLLSMEGVHAQELELEPMVVTATKRESHVQQVPISVTAISDELLKDLELRDSSAVAALTPNLQWLTEFGYSAPNIFIRGIGNTSFHSNAIGPVAVYADDVYLGSNIVQGFQMFDLERVEILRGPQGTLFGRNTTGGLVNYISRKPDLDEGFNARLSSTYGQFDTIVVDAAAGFPIGDRAAGRLALSYHSQKGIFDNINPGSGFNESGNSEVKAFRTQTLFQPTDAFEVLLNVHGSDNDSDLRPFKQIGVICPPGATPGLGSACTDRLGQRDSPDFHESSDNLKTREEVKTIGANLNLELKFDKFTITSISAFDHADLKRLEDTDHQPSAQLHNSYDSEVRFWSQELRIASNTDEPTQWMAGFYYYQDNLQQWTASDTNDLFGVLNPGAGPLFRSPVPEGLASKIHQKSQSFAIFSELTHRFFDKWQLSAGLRLTYDKRDVDVEALAWDATTTRNRFVSEQTARELFLLSTIPLQNRKDDWLQPSGRLALSYELADEQLVYASYARGFKSGEFNGGALFDPAEATLTDPEFVNSVEIGYKGRLLDNRLQLNASAFYMQFDDQQVFILASEQLPQQALANAASSEVMGIEAELEWLMYENWLFRLGIGYLDAKFDTFTDPIDPTNDLSGNRLPNAPKWSINGLVQYDWTFDIGIVRAQTDFFWYDKQFFTAQNNPLLSQKGYGVVNGRLAFMTHARKFEVALWVKNILDEDYFTAGFDQEALGWNVLGVGDPRMFGATLVVNFE